MVIVGCAATMSGGAVEEEMADALRQHYLFRLPHSHIYADYIWPGMVTSQERLRAVANWEVSEHDVIIASYPKSGTTWTSELVSAILYRGNIALLRSRRQDVRVPWLELDRSSWWIRMFYGWKEFFGLNKTTIVDNSKKGMRVWFTHLPVELLPKSVLEGDCRIIYVSRNPKDTAVSFFHFHRMARFLGLQKTTWDEFFSLFCTGWIYAGSWFEHVLGFWRLSKIKKDNMLFLKYEEMKKDLAGEVDRLSTFLNVQLDDDEKERVIRHCSFDSMSRNKMANRQGVWLFDQQISPFMRRGVVGDWTNYFTVAQSLYFDQLYQVKMADSQLTFDYL